MLAPWKELTVCELKWSWLSLFSGAKIPSGNNTSSQLIRRFYSCFKQFMLVWFIYSNFFRSQNINMSWVTKSWCRVKYGLGSISSLAHISRFKLCWKKFHNFFFYLVPSGFFNSWLGTIQKAQFYRVHSNSWFFGIPALISLITVKYEEK